MGWGGIIHAYALRGQARLKASRIAKRKKDHKYHGQEGTIMKANQKTARVQIQGEDAGLISWRSIQHPPGKPALAPPAGTKRPAPQEGAALAPPPKVRRGEAAQDDAEDLFGPLEELPAC